MPYEVVKPLGNGEYHLRDMTNGSDLPADESTMQYLQSSGQLQGGGYTPPAPVSVPPMTSGQSAVANGLQALQVHQPKRAPDPMAVDSVPVGGRPVAGATPNRIPVRSAPRQAPSDPNEGIIAVRTPGTKAGYVPMSRASQGIGEDAEDKLQADSEALRQSQLRTAHSRSEQQGAEHLATKARADDERLHYEMQAAAKQADINDRKMYEQTKRDELDARRDKVRTMQVDPDQVWAEKGVAARILSALAVGAGQFGVGMTGGRMQNTASQMISNMVDRSIDAQKNNIADSRSQLADDRDEFNRSIVGGAKALEEEQRELRLLSSAAYLRSIAADKDFRAIAPDALQAADEIEAKALDRNIKIESMTQQSSNERYQQAQAGGTRLMVDPMLGMREQVAKHKRGIAGDSGDSAQIIRDPSGNTIGRADEKTARELNATARQSSSMTEKLDEMAALMRQGSSLSPSDRARYKALAKSAQIDYKAQAQLGVLSEGDMPFLNDQIPPELGMTTNTSQALEAIETTKQNAARGLNIYYRQQGIAPPEAPENLRSR